MIRRVFLGCALAIALVAVGACGGSSSSARNASSSGGGGGAPVKNGGTVSFGEYTPVASLDPARIAGGGTAGGDEAGAIYGYLTRLDVSTDTYVPYMAKTITPNANFSQWTMTLRPGMTFTDGEPFNAQAVVTNLQRDMTPSKHSTAGTFLKAFVASMSTPNPTTVVFTLSQAWAGFPYLLSWTPGLIAAPHYLAEVDAGKQGVTPIGAGPYQVQSFLPLESLTLAPNRRFFGGAPHLASLKFVYIPGGPATLQAFQSNELQAALVDDPPTVHQARAAGIDNYDYVQDLGAIVLMNNRSTSPLANPTLRRAVAMAVSTSVYNTRVNQGTGITSSALFPRGSRWYNQSAPSIPYDPAQAKQLVDQVKSQTGWNGTLRFTCSNSPSQAQIPVALEAMLRPIGITLQVTNDIPQAQLITNIITKRDFDLACWGYNVLDLDPFPNLYLQLDSKSLNNFAGYANPAMDQALAALRVASTPSAKQAALSQIVTIWNQTIPSVNIDSADNMVIYQKNLHGLIFSSADITLFDNAYLS